MEKVPSKHAEVVSAAIIKALTKIGRKIHTSTSDIGRELSQHQLIAEAVGAKFYFAGPYASWERGYFSPKNGTDHVTGNGGEFAALGDY